MGKPNEVVAEENLDAEAPTDKAYIKILSGGMYEDGEGFYEDEFIKVQFNPTSYSIKSRSNVDAKNIGASDGADKYGEFSPDPRELSVTLFYDSIVQMDFLEKSKNIFNDVKSVIMKGGGVVETAMGLIEVVDKYPAEQDLNEMYLDRLSRLGTVMEMPPRLPWIAFIYGSTEFRGFVNDLSIKYKRFNKQGEVIRAEVSLSIKEVAEFAEESSSPAAAPAATGAAGASTPQVVKDEPINLSDLFG